MTFLKPLSKLFLKKSLGSIRRRYLIQDITFSQMTLVNDLYSKLQFDNFLLFCSILHDFTNLILIATALVTSVSLYETSRFYLHYVSKYVCTYIVHNFYQLVRANFVRFFSSNLEMQTAIVDVVISQFSSNTTTENLIEVEEVFGVGDFVFFAGQFLWRLALLARAR